MKKIAIVISSFSGKLDDEVKSNGMYSLPLQLTIEKEEWLEGFYNQETKNNIVKKFVNTSNYGTSLPPLGLMIEQMKQLSNEYDQVLYIPLSSELSGTCNALKNNARHYKNVKVFDNHLSGSALFHAGLECKRLYEEENKSIEEVLEFLKDFDDKTIGYIIPKGTEALIKSGRLKGAGKLLVSSMKLSIMILVSSVVKSGGVTRTKKSATVKVVDKILNFMKQKNLTIDDVEFTIIYNYDDEIPNLYLNVLKEKGIQITHKEESSIATLMHTGYGAAYLGINPKIKK